MPMQRSDLFIVNAAGLKYTGKKSLNFIGECRELDHVYYKKKLKSEKKNYGN